MKLNAVVAFSLSKRIINSWRLGCTVTTAHYATYRNPVDDDKMRLTPNPNLSIKENELMDSRLYCADVCLRYLQQRLDDAKKRLTAKSDLPSKENKLMESRLYCADGSLRYLQQLCR